jgi:hypothetical protein
MRRHVSNAGKFITSGSASEPACGFASSSLGLSTSEEKPRLGVGLDRLARYQNCSFSANWICREVVEVAVMTPPNGLYSAPWKTTSFGYDKFG